MTDRVKKLLVVGILIIIYIGSISSATQLSNKNNISTNDELVLMPLNSRKTIYVDDDNTEGPWFGTIDFPYQNIQDGLNAAEWHDTVYVFNGTYQERITIKEDYFRLIGENKKTTIIDGGKKGNVVTVKSDGVEIKGFTIKNSSEDSGHGIIVLNPQDDAEEEIIENNIISDNFVGIKIIDYVTSYHYIYKQYSRIKGNIIINNSYGIWLDSNHYFAGSYRNTVESNEIRDNKNTGITIIGICNIVKKNNFINNTKNAFFYHFISLLNRWDNNYWDNWAGSESYKIDGVKNILVPILVGWKKWDLILLPIGIYNYDYNPVEEPYDIITTQEYDIYKLN